MKLLKVLALSSLLLTVNTFAGTISGNTYCDINPQNGTQDPGETCTNENMWIKVQNVATGKIVSQEPALPSGEFSFSINKQGDFKLFVDSNGDGGDADPTPPANTLFAENDGSIDITLDDANPDSTGNKFGLIPDPVCDCTGADGTIIMDPITIDGIMSDWTNIYTDPDNTQCDSGCDTDFDINKTVNGEIQSTGRNLVRFSRTANPDLGYAYSSTKRVGSSKNTETFLFYRGGYDGRMHATTSTNGSVVLVAAWQGNTGTVKMEACDYDAIDDVNGDAMFWEQSDIDAPTPLLYPGGTNVPQSWLNKADGYTVQGSLTNCRKVDGLIAMGSDDGVEMEMQIPLTLLKLDPNLGFPYYHVSTMNANVNNSNPPGQIDDNLGPCELVPGPDFNLLVEKVASNTTPRVGKELTYTVTVTNNGPDEDTTGTIFANDLLPAGMTYINHSGTDWDCDDSGQNLNCTYGAIIVGVGGTSSPLEIIAKLDDNKSLWGETLTNTVCVESSIDDTPVCDDEDITVYTPQVALGITKIVSNDQPYINAKVWYEITVTNNGPDDATNVVVNDTLPAGIDFDYIHGDTGWSCNNVSPVSCTYTPTLHAGQSTSFHIHVDANSPVGVGIENTAYAHADENTTDVQDSDNLETASRPQGVLITTLKEINNPTPLIGETIIYTITVTNESNGTDAGTIDVNDTLPAEAVWVSDSASNDGGTPGSAYDETTGMWTIASLAKETSETLTITAIVTVPPAVVGTTFTNQACALLEHTTTPVCDDADATPRDPDVRMLINKTVDNRRPRINDQVTYTIEVENDGSDIAHNVSVIDALPPGVTYISSSPAGAYTPDTWDIGTLLPGTSEVLNITVSINAGQEDNVISNHACVDTDEDTQKCDDANLTVSKVIITSQKIASNNAPAEGDTVTYTIVVNNIGNAPADGIEVTDHLPDGVTYDSAIGNNWNLTNFPPTALYTQELIPGYPISFDVNVTVDPGTSGDTITNTACTEVSQYVDDAGDPLPVCTDVDITVNDNLDLAITKVVNNATPAEGTSVVYTITITNNGPLKATGVKVTEDAMYISALTVTAVNPSQGSMSDDETWEVGDLAVGASATLEVTATVNTGAAGGTFINNAVLTHLDQTDITSGNNHAQATINPVADDENCPCNDVKSDSSSAMGNVSAAMIILMTLMFGLYFVRREELNHANDKEA